MLTQSQQRIWAHGQDVWERLRGQNIFLTGGTGFFGRSLLEVVTAFNREKGLGLKVTVLTRDKKSFQENWPRFSESQWLSLVQGDIATFNFPNQTFDHILHFATPASATLNIEDPLKMFEVIVEGTRRVLEFSRLAKAKNVLLASSGAVYGRQPLELSHTSEEYLGAPRTNVKGSAYGEAKRVAELLGNIYSEKFNFNYKIARCFAFVGPHLDMKGTFAIGNFIKDAIHGRNIEIKGDGTPLRSYLYSDDLILWLFKILLDGKSQQPYNVGSDRALSIGDLARQVSQVLNSKGAIEILQAAKPGTLPERYVPSTHLAKSELGLDTWTSLEEAILETAKGYKQNLNSNHSSR